MKRAVAALVLLSFVRPALAADAPDTAPVMEGKPAPFSGILVREARFVKLLNDELKVPALEGRVLIEQRFGASIEEIWKSRLVEAVKPEPWWRSPYFHLFIGIVVGGLLTAAAIFGGAKIVEAASGN